MPKIIKDGVSYNTAPSTASGLPYNNSTSGLASSNVQGAIDELAQGGGGGGGGHTIVDEEGTSLTQRSNLQFNGAYSEDNATDDTTEVNVVRKMTKAEFDTLSDAEKVGFINITDITSGSDDRFQPVIYSEDEREIGVYTDGKPLYEKTIYSATVTDATEVAHNIANIDKVAEVKCNIMRYGTWNSGNFIFENNNHFSVVVSKSAYYCAFVPTTGVYSNLYLTIRYTKTTDTAGSGQWTPQGVPAVHYSTDEHIVGTWIDGSTLYEKTLEIAGPISDNSDYNAPHGITNLNNIVSHEGYAIYYNAYKIPIPYARSSTFFILNGWDSTNVTLEKMGLSYSVTDVRLTIRYTKSLS